MLDSLHIRNYVLIDSLDVSFPEGLSIITGQTGAGKSILLGALQLLLGGKAEATCISSGKDSCVVEGEFSLPDDSLRPFLEESGVEWSEDRSLVVRRVIYSTGRSRSFMNDSPVPVGVLSECSSRLVDIHSQHNNLILTDKRYQLRMLDHFAGNESLLAECRGVWGALRSKTAELEETERKLSQLRSEQEYNEARWKQLDGAHLVPGELEELEAEHKRLANAGEIKMNMEGALAAFELPGERSIAASLKEAGRLLGKTGEYLPEAEELSARLDSARIELEDIRESISRASSGVVVSEGRLQSVEDRMGLVYGLLQKFGCRTVEELASLRDEYAAKVSGSAGLQDALDSLAAEISSLEKKHASLCSALHASRERSAPVFAKQVEDQLRYLELDRAVFRVELPEAETGPRGSDGILFLFSSTGAAPADVARCASGGEISRIMLCLKARMARFAGMPTMIFDEIDTGVSGSAADKMGRMICEMGKDMQVLAITHLPQVAARGNAHFVVEKSGDASSIRRVEGEERVTELARLLSGAEITPEAMANARSLLS